MTCWCGTEGHVKHAETETLKVLQCRECGTVQLAPEHRMTTAFYAGEEYRESVDEEATPADFQRHDWRQRARLYWMDQDWRGKRVLDVGAGGGGFLEHIGMLTASMRAIEPCIAYWPHLKAIGANPYATIHDLSPGEFDVVVMHSTIEHLDNPKEVLTEAGTRLAPGGVLWLTTPAVPNQYHRYRKQHSWYFTVATLTALIARSGLMMVYSVVRNEDPRYKGGEPQIYACARRAS